MINGNGSGRHEGLDPATVLSDKLTHFGKSVQGLAAPVLRTDARTERIEDGVNKIVRHDAGQSYPMLALLGALVLVGLGTLAVLVLILLRLPHL